MQLTPCFSGVFGRAEGSLAALAAFSRWKPAEVAAVLFTQLKREC